LGDGGGKSDGSREKGFGALGARVRRRSFLEAKGEAG